MVIGFDASRSFKAEPTGTENYAHELLKSLLAVDSTNTYRLYLRNGEGVNDELLKAPNVIPVDIKTRRLWTQFGLALEVLRQQPDVLFIPAHTLPVIHRPGLKSVVTIHDLGAEYLPQHHQFPQKLYLNRSTEYAVKHATGLIAVSQATKNDLVKRLRADPKKISVILEGYDAQTYHRQPQVKIDRVKQQYDLKRPYLLFVGTIQPRKNLERLIAAFAQFRHKVIAEKMRELEATEFVMIGKKGWLSDAIYQAPAKYQVADSVRFLDYVKQTDLAAFYGGTEAFVFPSLFEGFGLPVLEAMACGAPILTSTVSSLPEVSGNAAVLVDPYSIDAIAQGIWDIVTNQALRAGVIGAQASQLAKFSWHKTAEQTLTVLANVVQGEKKK